MPQSLDAIYVHLIYSTKNRQPWIQTEIEEELRKYHAGILRNRDSPMISSNGTQIGPSGIDDLNRYIANQKEHHRIKAFQEEFRSFLAKYEVEYDERYVWD